MNFECGICNQLLYRGRGTKLERYVEVLVQHHRLKEVYKTLSNFGYENGSELDIKMILNHIANRSSPLPNWMMRSMHSFMKILVTPCGHLFHYFCFEEWKVFREMERCPLICPYCRQSCSQAYVVKLGPLVPIKKSLDDINKKDLTVANINSSGTRKSDKDLTMAVMAPPDDMTRRIQLIMEETYRRYQNMYWQNRGEIQPAEVYQLQVQQQQGLNIRDYFIATFKTLKKFEAWIPWICFFLSIWKIISYVNWKANDYDNESDDEDLLSDQCYYDWHFTIVVWISCCFCLLSDFNPGDDDDLKTDIFHDAQ